MIELSLIDRHDARQLLRDAENAQFVMVELGIVEREVEIARGSFGIALIFLEEVHGQLLKREILFQRAELVGDGGTDAPVFIALHLS